VDGKVICYADNMTGSLERAIAETNRRREKQTAWNAANGITPYTVKKNIADILDSVFEKDRVTVDKGLADTPAAGHNLKAAIADMEKRMREAAGNLDFEQAARLRDEIRRLQATELALADDPMARQSQIEDRAGSYAGPRGYGKAANLPATRAAKPSLDAMGPGTDREVPLGGEARAKGGGKPGRRRA
jgi:excinuclease ABC subunit B